MISSSPEKKPQVESDWQQVKLQADELYRVHDFHALYTLLLPYKANHQFSYSYGKGKRVYSKFMPFRAHGINSNSVLWLFEWRVILGLYFLFTKLGKLLQCMFLVINTGWPKLRRSQTLLVFNCNTIWVIDRNIQGFAFNFNVIKISMKLIINLVMIIIWVFSPMCYQNIECAKKCDWLQL